MLQNSDMIVSSLLDCDFYKFTMGQFIFKKHRGTPVRFELINRAKDIPLAKIIDENELRHQLDHVRAIRFRQSEIFYLRGINSYGPNLFSEDYLSFLQGLTLPEYSLTRRGDQFILAFEGKWEEVTFWETIALAIISELYYRALMESMTSSQIAVLYGRATTKLYDKLSLIKLRSPDAKISDFGQRRRHSFAWQEKAITMASEILGDSFVGTSNTLMAREFNMNPIGTNAHELPMAVTAIAPDSQKKQAQYQIIREWGEMYGQSLRIVLPDTYGSVQFFQDMPKDLAFDVAQNWRGMRQDSGDPFSEADAFYAWLLKHGANPKEKVCVFSDGLDWGDIINWHRTYSTAMNVPFGWGTMLTNDFVRCDPTENPLFKPFSMVCKVTMAGGNPAVKLSNNPEKATGPRDEVLKYMQIFGTAGQFEQKVKV